MILVKIILKNNPKNGVPFDLGYGRTFFGRLLDCWSNYFIIFSEGQYRSIHLLCLFKLYNKKIDFFELIFKKQIRIIFKIAIF